MKKIILKHEEFRVSDDAFFSSGLHSMTVRLERGYHPKRGETDDVRAICLDLMQSDVDDCFLMHADIRGREAKTSFAMSYGRMSGLYV